MQEEIKNLTKLLWGRKTEIDATRMKRGECRGFNYCDVCFGKENPQLKQCDVQIKWCDEKKEFRLHCIQERSGDFKEKVWVREQHSPQQQAPEETYMARVAMMATKLPSFQPIDMADITVSPPSAKEAPDQDTQQATC